ncbi:MAG: polyprenyl synthetase family protein [Bacteroidales bacterium]|nr:polyprenyl synthetase family protein [Bacteroidales bacterium]
MKEYTQLIEEMLQKEQWPSAPQNLYEPITYILNQGGKRVRPHLCLMAAELCGGSAMQAIKPALAFEMLHNFTLLHDDIMDKAALRRGMPTVYKKWNTNIAILSGDTLFAKAFEQMLRYEGANKDLLLQLFIRTTIEICEGQQYDLDFEMMEQVSGDTYIEMIRLKTAVMLAACLQAGALVAEADVPTQNLFYQFGIQMGLAFQIQDDYLDVYADADRFGKQLGGDIAENKKTYLSLMALQTAEGKDMEQLKYYFSKVDFDKQEKFLAVKHIYDQYQIGEKAMRLIHHYYNTAMDLMHQMNIPDAQKQTLKQYADLLIGRDF